MLEFVSKIIKKEQVADNTYALWLERPDGYDYQAGQFAQLAVTHPDMPEVKENMRIMSIGSAPSEKYLLFAMRLSKSNYKQAVKEVAVGTTMRLSVPRGHLNLPENHDRPVVFIAGGIGIVPFLGMIKANEVAEQPHDITLFYCSRKPSEAAFHTELESIDSSYLKYIPTFSRLNKGEEGWQGECGRIDIPMLERYIKDIKQPIYYIVGLTDMVKSIRDHLLEIGVPEEQLKVELYGNYKK